LINPPAAPASAALPASPATHVRTRPRKTLVSNLCYFQMGLFHMTPANYELPKTSDSKYPWKDKFNRLKATEEMIRFAGYILHQLQVDTINIDSDKSQKAPTDTSYTL
jgi:hypothetical protein